MKNLKFNNSNIATILGIGIAILNGWAGINWDNFQFDANTIKELTVSAMIAVGGYITEIKMKKPEGVG